MVEFRQDAEFFFRDASAREDAEDNRELERLLEVFGEGNIGEIMINAKAKSVPSFETPNASGVKKDPYIRTEMEYKGRGESITFKIGKASKSGMPRRPV